MIKTGHEILIGTGRRMSELKAAVERVARSNAKVLITGESGVGKEVVARVLHKGSDRAAGPFVPVNCAGLPETLLESELYGHVRGSFTGAYRDKPGKLELADGGTIFLDEVGEMTLRMQGLLLRFLETGELQKLGADGTSARVNARVIAATNRSLRDLIAQKLFREDLFYRLNVIHLEVPPLRQRTEDVPLLIDHFLQRMAGGPTPVPRKLASDALAALMDYRWPGNVRELQNLLERLLVTPRSDEIAAADLPDEIRTARAASSRPDRERRRTVVDDLYTRLVKDGELFWTAVYPLFMQREMTRANMRDLVKRGLQESRGSYKITLRLFNMEARDYKKFLNFLRKHDCLLPFKDFR